MKRAGQFVFDRGTCFGQQEGTVVGCEVFAGALSAHNNYM